MPYSKHFPFVFFLGLMVAGISLSGGCGSSSGGNNSSFNLMGSSSGASGGGASSGTITIGDGGVGAFGMRSTCANSASSSWACKVDQSCPSSSPTSLTGKVYDPAGLNPLYDIIVFIPNDPGTLPPIQPGTHTCNTCDVSIGNYVAATTTDATGSFTLNGVPTGSNVPVTVQIGKWRRTITMNIGNTCTSNAAADKSLRLPRKRSEGDMPQMAVLTGGCDDFGCFLSGMGIDPSEFSAPQGGGRLDVYQGMGMGGGGFLGGGGGGGNAATLSNGTAGNCQNASCPLWSSKSALEYYDIVMLSCECAENRQTKPVAGQQALHDWLGEGGKVFASHYHYTWFRDAPTTDFQGVANWGKQMQNDYAMATMGAYDVDTSFPKGATFGSWLGTVGALRSAGPPPQLALSPVADSVVSVNSPTVRWIYDPNTKDVKYMSFQTPIGGTTMTAGESPTYCGKAVYTDLHTAGEVQSTVASIPTGCPSGPLSAQQKALEFLFFDLSACVSNDSQPPPMVPPTM
jgi:hypothetical protein